MRGFALGAFYIGYVTTQLPGRLVAERFGPKNLLGLAVFGGAFLTLITPSAAQVNIAVLVVVRIMVGACEVRILVKVCEVRILVEVCEVRILVEVCEVRIL